jgi:FKBP-type peptidyl-prolyl cis-trans isomerase 2
VEALEGRLEELSSRLAAVDGNHMIAGSTSQAFSTADMCAPTSRDQIADGVEVIAGTATQDTSDESHQESIANDSALPELQRPFIPSIESINPRLQLASASY